MVRVKTKRTPKLLKTRTAHNGLPVLSWKVMWDGLVIGVIKKPSDGIWEYGGSYFPRRVDAVQKVIDTNKLSLVAEAW